MGNEMDLRDQYEYYDEWRNGEAWDEGISLEQYDMSCRMRDYGIESDY